MAWKAEEMHGTQKDTILIDQMILGGRGLGKKLVIDLQEMITMRSTFYDVHDLLLFLIFVWLIAGRFS